MKLCARFVAACILGVSGVLVGCHSPQWTTAEPISSTPLSASTNAVVLRTPMGYLDEPDLAQQLGMSQIMQAQNESFTRVLVSSVPKADMPGVTSLNNYVAFVNTTFSASQPDRVFQIIAVDAEPNPLAELGIPFIAVAWPHRADAGEPLSICESAALIFELPDAFWTLSWNAPNGAVLDDLDVLDLMLEHLEIEGSITTR